MKNFLLSAMIFSTHCLWTQDSISTKDLIPFSYSFDLVSGQLEGDGAEILRAAVSDADILLLGNNSRDKMESDLSKTLAELLNENDYKHFLMETGSQSAQVVKKICQTSDNTVHDFKMLNRQYAFQRKDLVYTPIPEFKNVQAAEFIDLLHNENWSIAGFGTESWTSFKMLSETMFHRIPPHNQELFKELYIQSMSLLDSLYNQFSSQTNEDIFNICNGLKQSEIYTQFLNNMSLFDLNQETLSELKFSIDYWWMYGNKQFYEKNKINSRNNKRQLKTALDKWHFNFQEDKLFVKMWHGHLAKGQTRNGFYGIGNTLLELGEYHNRKSLVIAVFRRYYTEDDITKDILEESSEYFKDVIALGQKDKWTLIDLRPLTQAIYWGTRPFGMPISRLMSRYDMILIPKTDQKTAYNY